MRLIALLLLMLCVTASLSAAPRGDENGWALFQKRDYAAALKRFEKEVNQLREYAPIHDAMGWCHYFLGDYDAAEAKFHDALTLEEKYKWSLQGLEAVAAARQAPVEQAAALLAAGRYQEARAAYQRIREGRTAAPRDTVEADALAGEAWCLYYLARYGDAVRMFRSALKVRSDCAAAYRGIAYCQYAEKDYREALTALQLSFKTEPNDLLARITAGWCHYLREDYENGLAEFRRASEIDRLDCRGRLGEAWCLYRMEKFQLAYEAFVTAIQLSPYAFDQELRAVVETTPEWRFLYNYVGWSALRARLDSWALREFQTAVQLDPGNLDAIRGLAFAYFRIEQYDSAEANADLAAPAEPSLPGVSFPTTLVDGSRAEINMDLASLLAWIDYREGRYTRALEGFRGVRERHPEWVDAACGEGWVLYSQGNFPAAAEVFAEAEQQLPGYVDVLSGKEAVRAWRYADYDAAWDQARSGQTKAALARFEGLKNRSDHRFPADRGDLLDASIGWVHYYDGNYAEATASFRAALEANPKLWLALQGYGYVLLAQKEYRLAAGRLQLALESPELAADADVISALGSCLLLAGDAEAAEEQFRRAVELNPGSAAALAGMGSYYLRVGKPVDARVELERAVYIDPTIADRPDLRAKMATEEELWKLHAALGWSWFYRGQFDRAEQEFVQALDKDPLEPSVPRGLGLVYLRTDRLRDAGFTLERFLANAPRTEPDWGVFSQTNSELGWALYTAGQFREALKVFNKLESLHDGQTVKYADPYDGQGWCYLKLGRVVEARKAFLEAVAISPRHESSLAGLETLAELK